MRNIKLLPVLFALGLMSLSCEAQTATPTLTAQQTSKLSASFAKLQSANAKVTAEQASVVAAQAKVSTLQQQAQQQQVAYNTLLAPTAPPPVVVAPPPVVVVPATPPAPHALTGVALKGHTYAGSSGAPAMNTIGANVILVCGGATTPTDSDGNTYVPLYSSILPGYATSTLYAAWGPKTSTADHFIFTGREPLVGAAFSGVASGPDQKASNPLGLSNSTLVTGSITPSHGSELIFACLAGTYFTANKTSAGPTTTLDSAFKPNDGMTENGTADAYQIQTKAAAVNTAFTTTADNGIAGLQVSFYSAAAPAPLTISSAALPSGNVSVPFTASLNPQGGVSPYTITVTSGALPGTISLSPTTGVLSGAPTATSSNAGGLVFTVTDAAGSKVSTSPLSLTINFAPPTITTTRCPSGTQLKAYAGCTLTATGGTPPYAWRYSTARGTTTIPEGLTLNPATGVISGTVTGQGVYDGTTIIVTDATGATDRKQIVFSINGDNTFGGTNPFFPVDSIFHGQNISALPVDTSPAAPTLTGNIHLVFGSHILGDGGMPISTVRWNQPNISVGCPKGPAGCFQSYFTSAPYSSATPMESTQNNSNASNYIGDGHSLVVQTAGGGQTAKLWETFGSQFVSGSWKDISNAKWDLGGYGMLPDDNGSTDAAGLPIAPLLANYDDVTSTGGMKRPIRFTISGAHTLQYHVLPATAQSGGGICTGGLYRSRARRTDSRRMAARLALHQPHAVLAIAQSSARFTV